jgi:nitrite reductase (NADH) small subunit
MERWIDVCVVDDIPVRGSRRTRFNGVEIALFRTSDDAVFAIENRCAHKGGPLSEGIVHDCAVTCPLHSWVFDLATGKARGADEGQIQTYPVEVRDGRAVHVRFPAR